MHFHISFSSFSHPRNRNHSKTNLFENDLFFLFVLFSQLIIHFRECWECFASWKLWRWFKQHFISILKVSTRIMINVHTYSRLLLFSILNYFVECQVLSFPTHLWICSSLHYAYNSFTLLTCRAMPIESIDADASLSCRLVFLQFILERIYVYISYHNCIDI